MSSGIQAEEDGPAAIREVTLGAGSRQPLTVGGGNGLPLHTFEAELSASAALALEITDVDPPRWPDSGAAPWDGVLGSSGRGGAQRCRTSSAPTW